MKEVDVWPWVSGGPVTNIVSAPGTTITKYRVRYILDGEVKEETLEASDGNIIFPEGSRPIRATEIKDREDNE